MEASALSWRDVAAGTMFVEGVLKNNPPGGRASLERGLLERAQSTWMLQAPELELLFMTSCEAALAAHDRDKDQPAPSWWEVAKQRLQQRLQQPTAPALPKIQWRCYGGPETLGKSLWRKTGALLATLYARFPQKSFYLKLDSDTMVFPRALLRFLQALHSNNPRARPLYFGSNRIASKTYFGQDRYGLFLSDPWKALEASRAEASAYTLSEHRPLSAGRRRKALGGGAAESPLGSNHKGVCQSRNVSYAQGGAYGFSQSALRALVGIQTRGALVGTHRGGAVAGTTQDTREPGTSCLEAVAAAVAQYRGNDTPLLFEDEAVGLCMYLHRVRLVTCRCFYDWGPCDIADPMRECKINTKESTLCRLPLTVHKLRRLEWYDGWWAFLAPREARALAQLDAYNAAALAA